jgi:hypothetical protein
MRRSEFNRYPGRRGALVIVVVPVVAHFDVVGRDWALSVDNRLRAATLN